MSEQMPPLTPPRYSGGQIVMLGVGTILVLPGVCSLLFMIGMAPDLARGNPYAGAFAGLWIVCYFVAAIGAALIYVARREARAGAANRSDAGEPRP